MSLIDNRLVGRMRRMRPVDKLVIQSQVMRSLRSGDPVLVFQNGKSGSTAVLEALTRTLDRPVVHCHVITEAGIARNESIRRETGVVRHNRPDWRGEAVRHWLAKSGSEPVDIVTMVREPVGHAISTFFQIAAEFGYLDPADTSDQPDVAPILDTFMASTANPLNRPDWFDSELRPVTGVDVYGTKFDTTKGYQCYASGRFRVLLLRYEDIREAAPKVLGEFLGIADVRIPEKNVTRAKAVGGAYRAFTESVALPRSFLDSVYDLPVSRWFYSEEERTNLARSWGHET